MESDIIIRERIQRVFKCLNEKQRRIYLAAEANSIGWGGISKISLLSGVSRSTIARGVREISEGVIDIDNKVPIRAKGGGRKKESERQPGLVDALKSLVEPHTMGDPQRPLIWSSKSSRKLSSELKVKGFDVSHEVVRQILLSLGYSLQSNKKTKEGGDHPDRNAQFEYINAHSEDFLSKGDPVISIDCKKKELIGSFKNGGREWNPKKTPQEVNVYDFANLSEGKAIPYGVYNVAHNKGWVNVGISSDTAAFAVATIRSWWESEGKELFSASTRLYINADGGGSNGSRNRLWKEELQQFSNNSGLEIHVSHYPPGTSKWNKIEHCLFAYISKNWRAKPLETLAVIVNLIGATTTTTGLVVKANVDENVYQTGIKISDQQTKKWNLERSAFHGEWNYIIRPNIDMFIL